MNISTGSSLSRLSSHHFNFERWRAGSLMELGIIKTRTKLIEQNKLIIRQCAIGYIPGDKLQVRAKPGTVAVMFWNGKHFWTHLTDKEFLICFPD